jgi:hypothetical protein
MMEQICRETLPPQFGFALREDLVCKFLHAAQRGPRGDAWCGHPLHLSCGVQIVPGHSVRDRRIPQSRHGPYWYHLT